MMFMDSEHRTFRVLFVQTDKKRDYRSQRYHLISNRNRKLPGLHQTEAGLILADFNMAA